MEASVQGEFGVERSREKAPLESGDWGPVGQACQDLDAGSDLLDDRGADEDSAKRAAVEARHRQIGLEAIDLPAEGVPPNRDVHGLQGGNTGVVESLGQDDHPCAGAPHGESVGGHVSQGVEQAGASHQLRDGRALAPGNDQPIQPDQILREPHLGGGSSQAAERLVVLAEIPLQGQDTDCRHGHSMTSDRDKDQ